jgi:hypothetical protein
MIYRRIGLIIVIAIFFTAAQGCAPKKIHYNVNEPLLQAAPKEKTIMLYGVYRQELSFRAIAVNDNEGVRVVILNDIGVKLQDMKLTKDNGTDIYFVIGFMPKNTIEEFERIFRQYFIDKTDTNVKIINNRLYFHENGEPVLWINKI